MESVFLSVGGGGGEGWSMFIHRRRRGGMESVCR